MYTNEEVLEAMEDSNLYGYVTAVCLECGDVRTVEPDAQDYHCFTDDCLGKLTSPLRFAGLI